MYRKVDWSSVEGVSPVDYYELPERIDGETRVIKPLADELDLAQVRPNIWHYPAGATLGRHRHEEQEEVYMVLEGAVTFTVDGEEVNAGRGDAVAVDAESWRQLRAEKDSTILVIGAPAVPGDTISDAGA